MKKLFFILFALSTLSGCTANYLGLNHDPYATTFEEQQRDGYYANAVLGALEGTVISLDINTTQFTEALLGNTMGGYYATTGGFKNTIENYNPTNDWSRVLMKSDQVIPRLYSYLTAMEGSVKDPILLSIAKIIKVATMHRVTDTYGPIFYTKIGLDGRLQVPYDSQEVIYDAMLAELDEVVTTLTANRGVAIQGSVARAEQVYGASPERWCRYANSLMLRLAMRIVYADQAKAKLWAEKAAGHQIGVIESNTDNPKVITFGVDGNPLYVATRYNQPATSVTGGDSHVAADIVCYMNGYDDPRREKYFVPCEWSNPAFSTQPWYNAALPTYIGKRRGTATWDIDLGRRYSGVNMSAGSPLYWMNAAEVAFLKAEAAGVFGFDMGAGSAQSFYEKGIELSFQQWGVTTGYVQYIADDTSTPTAYDDPAGLNSFSSALSPITVAWKNLGEDDTTLADIQERIITQKWIANFNLGNEAWADYRRTGFPRLMPVTEAGNLGASDILDRGKGARRMKYPQEEYTDNAANVKAAVSTLLGGPDLMRTPVWWDCNPAIWN